MGRWHPVLGCLGFRGPWVVVSERPEPGPGVLGSTVPWVHPGLEPVFVDRMLVGALAEALNRREAGNGALTKALTRRTAGITRISRRRPARDPVRLLRAAFFCQGSPGSRASGPRSLAPWVRGSRALGWWSLGPWARSRPEQCHRRRGGSQFFLRTEFVVVVGTVRTHSVGVQMGSVGLSLGQGACIQLEFNRRVNDACLMDNTAKM